MVELLLLDELKKAIDFEKTKKKTEQNKRREEKNRIAGLSEEPPHRLSDDSWRKMCELEKREVENLQHSLFDKQELSS